MTKSNETKVEASEPPEPMSWQELPLEVREVIYAYLRKEGVAAQFRGAEAKVAAMMQSKTTDSQYDSNAEATHFAIELAFRAALEELEINDPFFCGDCGYVHEPKEPHPSELS